MKKYLLLFIIPILFSCGSDDTAEVKILVITNILPDTVSVFITGNAEEFGGWQPDAVQLKKSGENEWSKEFRIKKGRKLEFKFTKGSWQSEALNPDGSVPNNYSFQVFSDTVISVQVDLWADQIERKVEGQITGTVNYYKDFKGKGIQPRDVIVWLPPGYETNLDDRYAVLYMHDGQNIVDPATSSFQVDWQLDEAADTLIRNGLIEPIIIVGIYNTPDRNLEYSEFFLGIAYMSFIVDSLKPFIDRNYRTLTDPQNTASGGGSLGALTAFLLSWEYPNYFSKALCFSPAFKVQQYDVVNNVIEDEDQKRKIKIYINNGDGELDTQLQSGVDEMLDALKSKNYVEDKDFFYVKAKNTLHGERDWSKNIWRALIFLFGTEKGRELL